MDIQSIKDQILKDLRIQYPESIIHEVKSFKKNDHGFYNISVVMEKDVLDTDNEVVHLQHHSTVVPFPRNEFEKLSLDEQKKWTTENVFEVRPMGKPSGMLFYIDFVYKGS